MFAQRLDFLMKLTNTQNIELARAIGVDASAVSRLRTGKRKPPKTHGFLPEMCAYFTTRLSNEHQKKTAADRICPGKLWPESIQESCALLGEWLIENEELKMSTTESLLLSISEIVFPSAPAMTPVQPIQLDENISRLYYGLEGVQQAMLDLLDIALASGQPRTICMFSDENGDWLNGNAEFLESWSKRLKQLIFLGGKVKIVHNISRPQEELIKGTIAWMPLYITGMVETYYYPKIRDGVYHRTLFIAEGLAAFHSSSIDGFSTGSLIHMLTEPRAVDALTNEFYSYLGLCRPMMEVVCGGEGFARLLHKYDRLPGDFFLGGATPSLFTMPEKVAEKICYRSGNRELMALYKLMRSYDLTGNGRRRICELICLPSDRQIYENEIPVGIAKPLGFLNCYYTAEEYKLHLQSIIEYARNNKDYKFALTDRIPSDIVVFCKEGECAIITKCNRPCVSFATERELTVGSLVSYFKHQYENSLNSVSVRGNLAELMRKLG